MEDVLIEALDLRRDEDRWQETFKFVNPTQQLTSGILANMLGQSVEEVVFGVLRDAHDASLEDRISPGPVLLIDLLVAINRRWCGIWPFCRATF